MRGPHPTILVMVAVGLMSATTEAAPGPSTLVKQLGFAPLGPGWEAHPGGDAAPPTSGWRPTGGDWSPFDDKTQWRQAAWYRIRFQVHPDWAGRSLALWLARLAQVEVYLDGARLEAHIPNDAEASPTPYVAAVFSLDEKPHELTIRINGPSFGLLTKREELPLSVGLGPAALQEHLPARFRALRIRSSLLVGAGLTLALLHLLLFLFRRKVRANFYFATTAFAGAALGTSQLLLWSASTLLQAFVFLHLFNASVLLACASGLMMLYELFHPDARRRGRLLLISSLVVLAADALIGRNILMAFSLLKLLEQLRMVFVSVRRREDGAWLLGMGAVAISITGGLQIASLLFNLVIAEGIYFEGDLLLLLCMSAYLARSHARAAGSLEEKLKEVEILSERTLKQERRAKEEEMRTKLLEAENQRKAQELEEAKKLEKVLSELRDTQSQLVHERKMASLGGLVAGIAHELNTPLGAISGARQSTARALEKLLAELPEELREEKKPAKLIRTLDTTIGVTKTGIERIDRIVKSLRRFAHIDEAELLGVQLEDGIRDTLVVLNHQIQESGVQLIDEIAPLPEVRCYASDINQVFLNVLQNAIDASSPGQSIMVRTEQLNTDRVAIVIEDQGKGIEKEHLERVFDPGYTTRGVGVGVGLGLSTAWKIVERHRGTIDIVSTPSKGTRVTIELPVL